MLRVVGEVGKWVKGYISPSASSRRPDLLFLLLKLLFP